MKKLATLFLIFVLTTLAFAQDDDMMLEGAVIDIDGLEINYYEMGEDGATIFLIHGNSGSARSYIHQLTELSESYHVIAMDLPGHGMSAYAEDPEATYNIPGYAEVVVAVAEELEATDAVFVGWSLGGHILLEAVEALPDAAGFMIFGTPPIGFPIPETAFLPSEDFLLAFTPDLTEDQIASFVSAFFSPDYVEDTADLPQSFIEDATASDGLTRGMLGASIGPDGYADEVVIVAEMEQPLAIIHGAQEQLVNLDYIVELDIPMLWMQEVQVIEDAGHATHYEAPEAFNELLMAFVDDVTMMDE